MSTAVITDPVGEFVSFHFAYNHVSEDRAQAVTRLLRLLEDFIGGDVAEMSAHDVERFLVSLNVAPATTLKHLKMLRPWFKWLYRQRLISAEQRIDLGEIRAPRGAGWGQPKPYSRHEIGCFWEEFDEAFPWTRETDLRKQTAYRAEFWVRRWQRDTSDWQKVYPYARRLQAEAIVALALFGGLRRIEIFNISIEDFHYENAYVRVAGAAKNPAGENVVRAVPMPDKMRLALANWIEFREQVLQPEHDQPWLCLWRDRYLEPMSLTALAHLLDHVGDGYELHRMRHTFATERLRAKMPVEKLQVILGHSNIAMTMRYARQGLEDILASAEKSNDEFSAAVARSHKP